MYRRFFTGFVLVLTLLGSPTDSGALDLGLTPSHVYSIWTNVNEALVSVAQTQADDTEWARRISTMQAGSFFGKKPADVLQQVRLFREKLDRLTAGSGLQPAGSIDISDGTEITPSVVFLNSGYVLDNVVLFIEHQTQPSHLLSQYFKAHDVRGKKPSDVYGLVELANRRLDRILNRASG